jgi:hypothetical protein
VPSNHNELIVTQCVGFPTHDLHATETALVVGGCSIMEPVMQFRQLAEECNRLAQEVQTEDQRRRLMEMAAAWRKVAEEYDREHSLS